VPTLYHTTPTPVVPSFSIEIPKKFHCFSKTKGKTVKTRKVFLKKDLKYPKKYDIIHHVCVGTPT